MRNPSLWVPAIVGFYVLILGLCLTGALKRQKVSIRQLRREQSSIFSMLDEDSSSDEKPSRSPVREKGGAGERKRAAKKTIDVREWESLGCR